jgi:tripartite-type tricarboxylate transporter receptor subunit TctC
MLRRALLTSLALPAVARAQPRWPTRPVRFVVPFAPGGPVEIPARFLTEQLTQSLGQPVIVETRGGAGGALGAQAVIAAQDGHTFLFTTGAIAIQPALQPEIGYDPLRDFVPVSLVSESPMGFAVRPANRFGSLAGLIAAAKADPGALTIGSSGTGTTTHMVSALFGLKAGISLTHVPYRGAGQMVGAFLAGDIDLMSAELSTILPHVREGRAVVLGQTGAIRSPVLPEVPTLAELVPGTAMPIWFALLGNRGTPPEAVARLGEAMAPLRQGSVLAARMAENGAALLLSGPEVLAARLAEEVPLWRQVVQQAGIKPD